MGDPEGASVLSLSLLFTKVKQVLVDGYLHFSNETIPLQYVSKASVVKLQQNLCSSFRNRSFKIPILICDQNRNIMWFYEGT